MKPTRFPLATDLLSRTNSTAKDARIVNGYVDDTGGNKYVVKRPGTALFYSPTTPSVGNGMYVFNNTVYFGMGATLYSLDYVGNATVKGTAGALGGLSSIAGTAIAGFIAGTLATGTNSGQLYFTSTATMPYLFFHNKVKGFTCNITANTTAQVSSVNFPPNQTPALPLVPGAVYTNNTVFVMTKTGRIYSSAIEDPTTWGALDYVSMTSEPELAVCLAKSVNYVVAFGTNYTEFFYYAGNPTGSPLAVNLSAKLEIGCANAESVVSLPSSLVYIGTSKESGKGVYIMSGLVPQKVSTKAVENFLNLDPLTSVKAFCTTIAGHTFYVLSLSQSNVTLVYDLNTKLWGQWSNLTGGVELSYEVGNFVSASGEGYLQSMGTGYIAKITPNSYTDEGSNIPFRIVTPIIEGMTNNLKFFQSLEVIGDKVVGSLNIRHSDDDYTTWSSYRQVDTNASRPVIRQLGSARRRSYEFYDEENKPLRILGVDALLREGTF
jgi:hypothetical protein